MPSLRRYIKPTVALSYDAFMAAIALLLALELRFDFNIPGDGWRYIPHALVYALLCFFVFYISNMHRNIWHYTSTRDLFKLGSVICLCALVGGITLALITRLENFPRSVLVLTPILHMIISTAPRFILRTLHDRPFKHGLPSMQESIESVLLIGLNDTADLFVRESFRQRPNRYQVMGIVDDTHDTHGRVFHNIPILGSAEQIGHFLDEFNQAGTPITTLVLTEQKISPYKEIIEIATARGLKIKRIPSISNLKEGDTLTDLKPVLIEDLLGRDCIDLDMSSLTEMVENKVILVTGAGGSIGSELCRQLAQRNPKHIILFEHNENALYRIELELRTTCPELNISFVLGDVKDKESVDQALQNFNVQLVFHAAAYKHVPMVEFNPIPGLENNLKGTAIVTDSCIQHNIERLVIISTDKAVNPTNIMGATKRASESYALWKALQPENKNTKIMAVRFGNVLGSNGSVIPLFKKQLLEGGPLTVTHKDVTRYFMTIPEAVQLVLKASSHGHNSALFMLDMGEPVKVWHLAEQMISLSGLTPYKDIDIIEIGLRPGEKLYEELSYNAETMEKTVDDKIFRVTKTKESKEVLAKYTQIMKCCAKDDMSGAVQALINMVPDYSPAANSPYYALKEKHANNKCGEEHDTKESA